MTDKELTALLTAIHADAADSPPSPALRGRLLAIAGSDASQPAATPSMARRPQRFVLLAAAASLAVLVTVGTLVLWLMLMPADDSLVVGTSPEAITPVPETPMATDEETSRRSDLVAGVSLEVEEVEPGVVRVVSDGIRDLAVPLPTWSYAEYSMALSVDDDGGIRIHPAPATYKGRPQEVHEGHEGSFRLGEPVDTPPGNRFSGGDADTSDDVEDPPAGVRVPGVGWLQPMVVGPDDSTWAVLECRGCARLFRLDTDGWTEFDADDGVPPIGGYELPVVLEVAPDGSVWVNSVPAYDEADYTVSGDACGGIHHFDGESWSRYLDGVCVYDLALAPDGTAWVRASSRPLGPDWSPETDEPVLVYAIRRGGFTSVGG